MPAGRAPSTECARWPTPPRPNPTDSLLVDGNRLTLLTEGPERLEALLGLIDGAKTLACGCSIICIATTGRAQLVAMRMERALDRGVTVALLIDGFGAYTPRPIFHAAGRARG